MPKHQDELCINEQYAGDYAKQIGDEIYLTNQNGEKEMLQSQMITEKSQDKSWNIYKIGIDIYFL